MSVFDEHGFRRRVDRALERVATILENTRNPKVSIDPNKTVVSRYVLT